MIGILTFERKHGRRKGTIGSSIIRGQWLTNHWPEAELYTEGKQFDAIIFQKAYWGDYMDDYEGIKILDLCDPDWMSNGFNVVEYAKKADAVTCGSKGIYDFLKKILKVPVYYIPDRVDLDFFGKPKEHFGKATTVAWFGYYHNAKDVLPFVMPVLAQHNLKLMVISENQVDMGGAYNVQLENRVFSWSTLKFDLQAADIVLNPQSMNYRFKFKSQNKTLISWACGLPIATNDIELEQFLDPDNRNKEVAKRRKEIESEWDVKKSIEEFKKVIDDVCQKKKKK